VRRPTITTAEPDQAVAPDIADDPAGADRLLRRVRWIAAGLCVVQFSLYSPPTGVIVPFSRWWGAVPTAMLVASNVVGLLRDRSGRPLVRSWFIIQLVWDGLITAVVLGMFTFDDTSALGARHLRHPVLRIYRP
jgi:hypothetical protein